MKEAALQKGLPVPDEAVTQERVLGKDVEAPDLATVKDFLRFHATTNKGKIMERLTSDSLNIRVSRCGGSRQVVLAVI